MVHVITEGEHAHCSESLILDSFDNLCDVTESWFNVLMWCVDFYKVKGSFVWLMWYNLNVTQLIHAHTCTCSDHRYVNVFFFCDPKGVCCACWIHLERNQNSTTPTTPSPRVTRLPGGSGTSTRSSLTPCFVSRQSVNTTSLTKTD